jgi:hypothetical protein
MEGRFAFMDIFELSREWWAYSAMNPVKPMHHALYFHILNKANSLHWRKEIGLPTSYTLGMIGTTSYKTYISALEDLQTFGFIKFIERAKNQYTSNTVALVYSTKADTKASSKQLPKQVQHNKTVNTNKESKNKVSENKEVFIPPTVEECIAYAKENNFSEQYGKDYFVHYDLAQWIDKKGFLVDNWKQKMQQWFKKDRATMQTHSQPTLPKL